MSKNDVSKYFDKATGPFRENLYELKTLIYDTVPDVTGKIKWGFAVFGNPKDFCYLRYSKNHITFGFYHYEKISEQPERLEGTGNSMRHIKIRTKGDIDKKLFANWLTAISQ